jgi:hypothetical protein
MATASIEGAYFCLARLLPFHLLQLVVHQVLHQVLVPRNNKENQDDNIGNGSGSSSSSAVDAAAAAGAGRTD